MGLKSVLTENASYLVKHFQVSQPQFEKQTLLSESNFKLTSVSFDSETETLLRNKLYSEMEALLRNESLLRNGSFTQK